MSDHMDPVGTAAPPDQATPGIAFDPAAVRAWLDSPDPEEEGYTVASALGVSDDDLFGYELLDFTSSLEELVGDASSAGMFGTGWLVSLWLTYDPSAGYDGGLVTVDLPGSSVRLAGLHLDHKEMTLDRDATGTAAAIAVLAAIASEAEAIVSGFRRAQADGFRPRADPETGS